MIRQDIKMDLNYTLMVASPSALEELWKASSGSQEAILGVLMNPSATGDLIREVWGLVRRSALLDQTVAAHRNTPTTILKEIAATSVDAAAKYTAERALENE